MIVMPAASCGWFWHALARETGRLGHLISPGDQRGPWPWFPYALDNGAFACWEPTSNTFDGGKWQTAEAKWHRLIFWAQSVALRPRWAIVPDVPGNWGATIERWSRYAQHVQAASIPLAVAVQDGATVESVQSLSPAPDVVCVGGSTEWKWKTAAMWAAAYPRTHLLRCNAPDKLYWLESIGYESCDGTGWSRGDRKQTEGLETWARSRAKPVKDLLWPHVCRAKKQKLQETFA